MPRSNRFNGYVNNVEEEEEEEVICPHCQHRVRVSDISQHLKACKNKIRQGPDYKVCPYNRKHHVAAAGYDSHVEECPDAPEDSNIGTNRFGGWMSSRKYQNGHANHNVPEKHDSDIKSRLGNLKQPVSGGGRHVEQFAAPKGCKIGKGFGFTKGQESGNFVRERSFRGAKEYSDESFDDQSSPGNRSRKGYLRSKSNLDEDTIRQAQRNAVDQVREFQNVFNQRASAKPNEEAERFTRLRELPSTFAKLPHHEYGYDDPPVERAAGYGRGRKIIDAEPMQQRPGPIWNRIQGEDAEQDYGYKEETLSSVRDSALASSRFTILKASKVFGPVEVAQPALSGVVHVGKGFSAPAVEEEDWGNGGGNVLRAFPILKPSDVFRLDYRDDPVVRRPHQENGSYFNDIHNRGSFGRGELHHGRRFDFKNPDEVFSNEQSGLQRFPRSRTPPRFNQNAKTDLPWPFNRFAENPNAGRRYEEKISNREPSVKHDDVTRFPMNGAFARKSPPPPERNGFTKSHQEEREADEEERSCVLSECDIGSNAETMSSSGGGTKHPNSISPSSQHGSGRDGSRTPDGAAASGTKPKVLSIYEQYEHFGLDDDDLNFLKPAETAEPPLLADPTMGGIFAHLRMFGVSQSPFGSSHSSSPFSASMAP